MSLLLEVAKRASPSRSYKQTIGVDFFLKQIILPGDKQVAVQVSKNGQLQSCAVLTCMLVVIYCKSCSNLTVYV